MIHTTVTVVPLVALLTYAFPPHSTVAEIEAWEGRGEGVVARVVRAVT